MAGSEADNTEALAAPAASGRARFLRYVLVLGLLGAVVLVWLSLLSYSPTDPPSPAVYPAKVPAENAAGIVGAHLAHFLRYWLGGGAYMGLLFATVAAGLMLFGGRLGELPWRLTGVALLITATSSAIFVAAPESGGDVLSGSAGILGIGVGQVLLSRMAPVGSWIILGVTLAVGLMLTADNLVLRIPRLGRRAWQRGRDLPQIVGAMRARAMRSGYAGRAGITASPRAVAVVPASASAAVAEAPPRAPCPAPGQAGTYEDEGPPRSRPAMPSPLRRKKTPPETPQPAPAESADGAGYVLPSAELLADAPGGYNEAREVQAAQKKLILQQTLDDFNVAAEVLGYKTGPVITLFEVSLSPGVKVSQVMNLAADISRALAVPGVRVVSPLPGRDTIGIEVPNMDKEIVCLKELMDMVPEADDKMFLPMYLGKDVAGDAIVTDLAVMPHLLLAGTTGSGKSVCINSIIMAMLLRRRPDDVRLILIDPKMVEMAAFESIPHLLCPVVNDVRRAEDILEWAAAKMDERYELLKEAGVKNIAGYNRLSPGQIYERFGAADDEERARVPTHLSRYVIIVDELADLVMTTSKEVEGYIIRIAQKARAVGIHLILATQRPSVNVVTGLIKSNMPCRISFRVASRQESRIVLDQNGADVLLGQGDMLFLQPGTSNLVRAQGTYVDEAEIRDVVAALRGTGVEYDAELMRLNARPSGEFDADRDELFAPAVEIVLASQRGSVSLLQRRLQIGYSRASRIIDQMADVGILGEYKGSQARECQMTLEEWEALQQSIAADQSGASSVDGEPTCA